MRKTLMVLSGLTTVLAAGLAGASHGVQTVSNLLFQMAKGTK